jgi:hypothetical protein
MSERIISDKEALNVLNRKTTENYRYATQFVDRTIVYPVTVKKANGTEDVEIRTFVRAGEYTSPRRWEKALEVEKQYKDLNTAYTKSLRDAGIPERRIKVKELANPMKFTPLTD